MPTLVNTDGELIQFSKSYFKLAIAPEEALNRLLPLTLLNVSEELLHNVNCDHDKTGKIKRIQFSWLKKWNKKHKNLETTIMGEITIENGGLILETNSEKRTEKGKKLLDKYLGNAIGFQQTLIESPEQKLKSLPKQSDRAQKTDSLLESPEMQSKIKAMAKAHWENWFDEPIPELYRNIIGMPALLDKLFLYVY